MADAPAQADAQTCRDEDEGDDEGGTGDVEGPAGHVSAQGGSAVSIAQLGEVLEIGQVRMMKTKFPDVFESLGHLLHFSGGKEVERVPVPFVMEDAVVQPDRPVGGNEVIREHALTSGWYLELLGPPFQVHLGGLSVSALDVHGGVLR